MRSLWDLLETEDLGQLGDWIATNLRDPRELEPEELDNLLRLVARDVVKQLRDADLGHAAPIQ